MGHSRWNIRPTVPDKVLTSFAGLSPLLAQVLYNRNLNEPSLLEDFILADDRLSGDPSLLPGMHQAVGRIYQALLSGESIAVYGDFDTDGITSTALLVQGLSLIGGKIIPYIPHRLTEGYGLKVSALEKLQQQGVSLVITVDCGITALTEVRKAKKMGLDIIITDHHTPLDTLPPANAVVNPRLAGSSYPFPELAGVGVAFKLLQAVFRSIGKEQYLSQLMDLVALGTVADMMPLVGENRYLVKQGLKVLSASPRPGIRELIARSGLDSTNLTSESISWFIAPRLNAAGRLEHAMSSYTLLMTDSEPEAHELALWLEQKNSERQKLTADASARAREQVLAQGIQPLLVASDRDFPVGICGLVASRLAEEFYRPAIVIRSGESISSGSGRSIPEFNIIQALARCRNLFTHFGGHSQAAGFTLPTKDLPRLQQALLEIATTELDGVDLRSTLDIDAEVGLSNLGGDTFPTIQKLAPFGYGNPLPTFLTRGVEIVDCRPMGNNGGHLKLKLKQTNTVWDGVGFRLGNYLTEVSSPLDIVYNLELDQWGGQRRLRLNILDFDTTRV
ncbi:MAG: single-stranded-DNA-specific exonuclease RecJ [Dehalococcoidales bacterium]|nr:single-stranded-DNA-specific exonuclease RecJ [Dehalococcoidales bacterium]